MMDTEGYSGVEQGMEQRPAQPQVPPPPQPQVPPPPQPPQVERPVEPQRPVARPSGVSATQVIDYVWWIVAAVILLRFVFMLIGANRTNPFVNLLYSFTDPMVLFFKGIVGDINVGTPPKQYVLELSSLIALLIFWLLYHAILRLVVMLRTSGRQSGYGH